MKKSMIYLLIVAVLCIAGVVIYFSKKVPDYEPVFNIVVFTGSAGDKIYLVEKVWGISADHRQVLITEMRPDGAIITDTNYVFNGYTPFLYKYDNDTLNIYTQNPSIEKKPFIGGIKVEQNILNNPQMIRLLTEYEEHGLIKLGY